MKKTRARAGESQKRCRLGGLVRGDRYVTVNVEIPHGLDAEQKELLTELGETLEGDFNKSKRRRRKK